eukprot:9926569-Prorocentrum_lima.AAC.1
MTSSLVGSEMCIRDRVRYTSGKKGTRWYQDGESCESSVNLKRRGELSYCLLYTSDAADDM